MNAFIMQSKNDMMDSTSSSSGLPTTRFPFRLHRMIQEASHLGRDDLIAWLPCGTKFRIGKQNEFAKKIMSKYCRHAKYKSFLRQLSMYKFQRISSGPNKGCYFHPHFLRNNIELAEHINRERIEDIPASQLMKKPTEVGSVGATTNFSASGTSSMPMVTFHTSMDESQSGTVVSIENVLPFSALHHQRRTSDAFRVEEKDGLQVVAGVPITPISPSPTPPPSDDIVNEIINTFRLTANPSRLPQVVKAAPPRVDAAAEEADVDLFFSDENDDNILEGLAMGTAIMATGV